MSGVDEEEDGAKGGQPEEESSPGRSHTHESSPVVKPTPPAPPQWRSDDDRRFSGLARQEGPSGWSKTGEQPKTTMKATKTIFMEVPPSRCALCRGLLTDPVCTTCGHLFCRQCLISYYDPSAPSKEFFCPQCGERTRLCMESIRMVRLLEISDEHKVGLRRTFEHGTEGSDEPGGRTALDRIDTNMYITEGLCEDSNTQRYLKILPGRRTKIESTNIFQVFPRQRKSIRLVLTSGIAGIGKTLLVQRFTLEWANGSENQDVSMIFLLSFRELNLIRDKQYSLLELLSAFYPTLQEVTDVDLHRLKLLFILDGLDESRFSLDFENEEVVIDVKQASSVGTLLTNLIRGILLPSALLWITTRPAAAGQILPRYVDRETEMEGFTDAQQEEYFRKRFSDEVLSGRIISHIKTSKNLHIMCRIPLSCRVTATVLEHIVGKTHGGALPKTLTNLYAHFLMVQIKKGMHKTVERHEEKKVNKGENTTDKVFLLKLGKLALEHLEKGNIMFFQEDLDQCGLDATEVATFSEVYTEIFKRECVIFQKPVYCFVHLSIQGFLAAVYLFNCIINGNTVVLESFLGVPQNRDVSQDVFFKRAMEKSLESKNGHLDLFVRFLHGLSLWSNQKLLVDLLGPTQDKPELMTKAIDNLKTMTSRDMSPDRNVNIFHCLMEINSLSVHPEIQDFMRSQRLSTVHCSALADMLQMSEEVLDELNLTKYNASPEGKERLIPAVRNCRKAVLSGVRFSSAHSEIVASALESDPSHLRELDLRRCFLDPSQMSRLCEGLKSKNCRLETLRLSGVRFSSAHSEIVASALKSDPSHLRELDLRGFDLNPPQMLRLCKGLKNKNCRLETLRLRDCRLFKKGCVDLVSALQFNPSHLRNLDLTSTHLEDSFVEELRHLVENPKSQLKSLRISKSSKSSEREMWTSVDLCLESTSALSEDVANMKLGAESDRFEENTKLEKIPKSFTPEVTAESTQISFSYLCPGPGLFQCALTGLVFFTVGEAKLQYCMAQWDESLLQTAGKRPAGPLFNIYCPDDAVRELHFPHCHIEAVPLSAGLLSVAHVSDPGMSVLTPLAITHTHVVVKVPHLSLFGLLWDFTSRFWSKTTPIRSQVLLFLRPPNTKTKKKNLHVLLLPSNVPVEVVRAKHRDSLYIAAPSDCQLLKDEDYSVRCPHALLVQPPKKDFHQDFGPNFHPTFEIRLPSDTEETTVTVEKQSLTAWVCEVDLSGQPRKSLEKDAEEILFLKRDQIVQRISEATLRKLLDELLQREVIHDEEMQLIKTKDTSQDKARELIDMVRKKGKAPCWILTETLRKLEPDLSNELQLA